MATNHGVGGRGAVSQHGDQPWCRRKGGPYHSMATNHGVGNFSCAVGEERDREHAYVTAGFKPLTAFNKSINWPAGF